MIKNTGQALIGLEKILQETFLPCTFFGKLKTLPPIAESLSALPVKKAGTGLQSLVTLAKDKYTSFLRASDKLIDAVKGERVFQLPITSRRLKGRDMTKNRSVYRE